MEAIPLSLLGVAWEDVRILVVHFLHSILTFIEAFDVGVIQVAVQEESSVLSDHEETTPGD